ncbi:hypothetical protein [Variovorax sp. ZT4R33]|uniref:hypothetical protein n=1 Tax=Variovorax sp. ZT4R33 TaxID=3443743 RepID=UPI003F46C819
MTETSTGPLWSQDQAIAYECARECINELAAIYTGFIEQERTSVRPDQERIDALRSTRTRLVREQQALHVRDDAAVARINKLYSAQVRELRASVFLRRGA